MTRRWQERLAFALPDFALTLLFATLNGWYLYFLVNIAFLPPFLAGLGFALGRFVDAILDPLVGVWSDRSARIPTMRIGVVAIAPSYILLWVLPSYLPGGIAKFLATVGAFSAFSLAYTMISVPRIALLADFAPDRGERTVQSAVNMIFVVTALLFASTLFPLFVAGTDIAQDLSGAEPRSWVIMATIIAVIAGVCYLPFFSLVRERGRQGERKKYEPVRSVIEVFYTSGAVAFLAVFTLTAFAMVALQSMLPFFLETLVGLAKAEQAPVLALVFGVALLSVPVWTWIGRRRGKVFCLALGHVFFIIFLGNGIFLQNDDGFPAPLILASILVGCAIASLSIFPWAILPDIAERHRERIGFRSEGAAVAIFTMANKATVAGAILINSLVLSLAGHVAGRAEQSEMVNDAILAGAIVIPLICSFIALLLILTKGKYFF